VYNQPPISHRQTAAVHKVWRNIKSFYSLRRRLWLEARGQYWLPLPGTDNFGWMPSSRSPFDDSCELPVFVIMTLSLLFVFIAAAVSFPTGFICSLSSGAGLKISSYRYGWKTMMLYSLKKLYFRTLVLFRINDYSLTTRILEIVRIKCGDKEGQIWPYMLQVRIPGTGTKLRLRLLPSVI
jgi:hypothetical protein